MASRQQKGFSLIEVLVAATIMFSVLVSAYLAFQSSIIASAKAQSRIELLAEIPRIRSNITEALRVQGLLQGRGALGQSIYVWEAAPKSQGVALDMSAQSSSGSDFVEREFYLWNVTVNVELDGQSREFTFTEFTWGNQ